MNTRARTWASALVVACGTLGAAAAGPVVVVPGAGGMTLALPGQPAFHTASGGVSTPRMVQVPGTPTLLITWNERDAGGPVRPMYAIALDGRKIDTVQPANYVIDMQYAAFDPLVATPGVPDQMKAPAGNELYIVQYITQPLPVMQDGVRSAGGSIQRYLPQWSQVVRMTPAARARVAALPYVRWVGEYHPAYRMTPAVYAAAASAGGTADAPARYSIETLVDGPGQQQALSALIAGMGGTVNVLTLDQARMEATLTPAQLLAVARRNEVNFIDPWLGPGGADMNMIRKIGGAVPILEDAGFTGQGVRGEVFDTETRNTHQGFQTPGPIKHSNSWTSPGGAHGTACYGIVFAKWTAEPDATGMLPGREQGIFFAFSEASSFGGATSRLTLNTQATNPALQWKSSFQTSSVGNVQVTEYTTISAETDDYLFKVDYLSCQSQSNTGSQLSRPEAWAKNIVSVGGIDHKNSLPKTDDTFANGSSIGPASDGRVKPDLAHSFLDVFTTWGDSDTATTQFSGTSGATPIVGGHFGLLMQMWHAGVWEGFGGGTSVFTDRPKAMTAKALMINTAYRYTWTGIPPAGEPVRSTIKREIQGWGMPDVGNMYNLRDRSFIVNETDAIVPLGKKEYRIDVVLGEPNLNVTMAYKDPKASPIAQSQHRVNNLDLKVTSPSGVIYWGNSGLTKLSVSAPTNLSLPGGTAGSLKDTVENVFIRDPEPGQWKVEVSGPEITADGNLATPAVDAVYGLVVTGGVQLPPVLISLPNGLPESLPRDVGTTIDVKILPGSQGAAPSTAKVFYRYGPGAFSEAPLTYLGGTDYRATLTPSSCSAVPEFYISAQGDGGGTSVLPVLAPTQFFSAPVGSVITLVSDNFQNNTGWTVENTFVQEGAWTRAVPVGALAAPSADFDGSGQCFLTGPLALEDVDGGPTVITSPTYDITGIGNAKLGYALWHWTNEVGSSDSVVVSISNDNGQSWHQVEKYKGTGGWVFKKLPIVDFVPPSGQMKVRLSIADDPNNSVTEAALDAFMITRVLCVAPCYADCNGDGTLNLADFGCFQTKFATGQAYADCNGDGVRNLSDFGCFQTKFAVGCP